MRLLVLLVLLAVPSLARADRLASPSALCRGAIAAAERAASVPERLMQSIGIMESGRRDETGVISPWPWTINAEGVGSFFNSKAEAIAAVTSLRARGVRSIDVGCMQVNLMYHGDAFSSLDEAFDPVANARYAGRFLQQLLARTGSWNGAIAGYHSLTPEIGGDYARKVMAIWARPAPPEPPAAEALVQQAAAKPWAPPAAVPSASFAMSVGGGARIIPLPSSIAAVATPGTTAGRGLDAYRAAPTRLVARLLPGRLDPSS